MASKIAQTISKHLHSKPYWALSEAFLSEQIDEAIKGKTISTKEIARLQEGEQILASAIDANNDLLRTNSELRAEVKQLDSLGLWACKLATGAICKEEEFRNKLWDAEQEIHDLKREREIEREIGQEVYGRALALENWNCLQVVTQEIKPDPAPEQIMPPPCLKPLDAMRWNEQVVTGSITY